MGVIVILHMDVYNA